jgi:3-deoxy-manno-octulosonate cytidylyltransferase (CMP-KDO synthetase)
MKIIGIIPARYESSRFPGKPLADILGESMIQRVYNKCLLATSLQDVYVATDDQRIFDHIESFGGKVIMTKSTHTNGTERCKEVLSKIKSNDIDVVINIQGDEPFISPNQIDLLANIFFLYPETQIGTLIKKIEDYDTLFNPNTPKVVFTPNNDALYFSRNTIPYQRDHDQSTWLDNHDYFKHIGIYGYTSKTLNEIVDTDETSLESTEKLEQLRWLENGFRIKVAKTTHETIGIDTPEDLERVIKSLSNAH